MIYLLRNYVELAFLALKEESQIDYFLYRFEISKYELKNDLLVIKDLANEHGFAIENDDKRISIRIIDEDKFDRSYKSLFSFYYIYCFFFNDNNILIQLLISSELLNLDYFIVDDFAEKFGCSKSNLRIPLKNARDYIEKFGISIINKPYYGIHTVGNEFNIRKCLSRIYNKLIPEVINVEEDWKVLGKYEYDIIYYKFHEFCKYNDLKYSAEDNKVICYYLTIVKQRLKNNKVIEVIDVEHNILSLLKTNRNLERIAKDIYKYFEFEISDNEILALMVILLIHNTNKYDILEYVKQLYSNELYELKHLMFSRISEIYHLNLNANDIYGSVFEEALCSIILKKHTNELNEVTESILGNTPNVYSHPLCYVINKTLAGVLNDYYQTNIYFAATECLADIMNYYIENLDYHFKKKNILVSSRFNKYSPLLMKNRLLKELDPRYISSIDICEFSDMMYNYDYYTKKYDLVLSDVTARKTSNNVINFSEVDSSIVKLEAYLRLNRDMCNGLVHNNGKLIVFTKDFDNIHNAKEYCYNCEYYTIDEIKNSYMSHFILKDILLLLIPYDGNDCIIQIGNCDKSIIDNIRISNYLILKCNISEENARIINVILHEIIYDSVFFDNLRINPSRKTINDQINMIIK